MNIGLAIKVAFWFIIIGITAQLTPDPAWPDWVAKMMVAMGVAIVVTSIAVPLIRNRKKN